MLQVYLEYSKDNDWTGQEMVDHAIAVALPIFRLAFPGMILFLIFILTNITDSNFWGLDNV